VSLKVFGEILSEIQNSQSPIRGYHTILLHNFEVNFSNTAKLLPNFKGFILANSLRVLENLDLIPLDPILIFRVLF